MAFPEYKGRTVGFAKIMAELPISDGKLAHEIINFHGTSDGSLDSRFAIMPLVPDQWNTEGKDFLIEFQPPELSEVLAMQYMKFDGECPELLILTSNGVYRFLPPNRTGRIPFGSIETDVSSSNGLVEQFYYDNSNLKRSVKPQTKVMFPPQTEVVGNRIYFTFCDGGASFVWDGTRIREFGYSQSPSNPYVLGPATEDGAKNKNTGGFSDSGRIGTLNYNLSTTDDDKNVITSGGIESGLYYYAVVYENEDGAYSVTSEKSNRVNINFMVPPAGSLAADFGLQFLKRRFWICDVPKGPVGTVARVLVRTMNLASLPPGDVGRLRFLHRIPNNSATEYMDDIPDSELGSEWDHRRNVPIGFFFMKFFSGSMFVMRTEQYPARVWWSEQGTTTGSIPESFLHSHWRDVFPETGGITGALSTSFNGKQAMLVFKESATHYIAGSYAQPGTEGWTFGTISTIAGCSGPNLSQSSPDGQVVWYGNGTFWMLNPEEGGGVIDIGATIRSRLSKVNNEAERFGVSWVNKTNKEMVFCLPYKDSSKPNLQFVWDYINRGWRLRQDLVMNAVEQIGDLNLVAGSWRGVTGFRGDGRVETPTTLSPTSADIPPIDESTIDTLPTNTIYVYGNGYANYNPGSELIATYKTGWSNFEEFGPGFHISQRAADSVFTMVERCSRIATVRTFADWDYDSPLANDLEISLVHPENNGIDVYGGSQPHLESETENTEVGSYGSDSSVYRKSRTYTHRLAVDVPSCTVFSLELSASSISEPMSILSIDAYGPQTSTAGSRSPALYEK
tara:strand:- start:5480 stop:7849 length:2370 start_codon:yes stop_codon:yes gene_type:complete